MTRFATINVGVSKTGAILSALSEVKVNLMALQEIDVFQASCASYVQEWKAHGFETLLGELEHGQTFCVPRLQVSNPQSVSEWHLLPSKGCDWHVDQHGVRKILISSIYCHAADRDAAGILVRKTRNALSQSRLAWIILGDFNMTQEEGGVLELIANGDAYGLDDRQEGHRRLDFGLASRGLFATKLMQVPGICDHDAVVYGFESLNHLDGLRAPLRSKESPC